MGQLSQTISFRVDGEFALELERRAVKDGISRGDYARRLVIAALTNDPAEETRNRVAEMQDQLQRMREEYWSGINAMLVWVGKMDPNDAANHIQNHLLK